MHLYFTEDPNNCHAKLTCQLPSLSLAVLRRHKILTSLLETSCRFSDHDFEFPNMSDLSFFHEVTQDRHIFKDVKLITSYSLTKKKNDDCIIGLCWLLLPTDCSDVNIKIWVEAAIKNFHFKLNFYFLAAVPLMTACPII